MLFEIEAVCSFHNKIKAVKHIVSKYFYCLYIVWRVGFVWERGKAVGLAVRSHPTRGGVVVMPSDALRHLPVVIDPQLRRTTSAEEVPAIPELTPIRLLVHEPERMILIYK